MLQSLEEIMHVSLNVPQERPSQTGNIPVTRPYLESGSWTCQLQDHVQVVQARPRERIADVAVHERQEEVVIVVQFTPQEPAEFGEQT